MFGLVESIYIISDSVGETASLVVKAVTTQFSGGYIQTERHSHVESIEDIEQILALAKNSPSVIAYTIVVPELKKYLDKRAKEEKIVAVDLLNPLMTAIENTFHRVPSHEPKLMRKLDDDYYRKIEAVEFAVKCDDGRDPKGLLHADIVLVGVSRTSKTPLSMYLAHKGYKVANVPLVPEVEAPKELFEISKEKCVGLIISPDNLFTIRQERIKHLGLASDANYADSVRIQEELAYANTIMQKIGCPVLNVSDKAIEETAEHILDLLKLSKTKHL